MIDIEICWISWRLAMKTTWSREIPLWLGETEFSNKMGMKYVDWYYTNSIFTEVGNISLYFQLNSIMEIKDEA